MPRRSEGRSDHLTAPFGKISIIGVGLIGASFAAAVRKHGICGRITGCGRNADNLRRALDRGFIDDFDLDPAAACADADLILLSTPVGSFVRLAERMAPGLKRGALVTDAGSVKGGLVGELETLMPSGVSFVGGHPIAGSDRSGIEAAQDSLFANALCIITPTSRSNAAAVGRVTALWQTFGCRIEQMDPFLHDRIFGAVSHLPHLAAFALVNAVGELDPGFLRYAGQGFRDTTRIAASAPDVWRDICIANRDCLVEQLGVFRNRLDRLSDLLAARDADELERLFKAAKALREPLG